MAIEVTLVLRFVDARDVNAFREGVESEFECDIVEDTWEEEEV